MEDEVVRNPHVVKAGLLGGAGYLEHRRPVPERVDARQRDADSCPWLCGHRPHTASVSALAAPVSSRSAAERWSSLRPFSDRAPCSVTTQSTSVREVPTGPLNRLTTRVDGSARIGVPPDAAAARRKSTWPPMAPSGRPSIDSVFACPAEVDLERAVDRAQPPDGGQRSGRVGIADGPEHDVLPIVERVEQAVAAECRPRHGEPSIGSLARVGDDARLDQVEHAVGDHPRMYAEIPMLAERLHDRFRERTDA